MEERFDDDGEPRGCAGQPILNVLRGAELVETALLVVRYFGGIKLGTGGMVRAYSAAARAVVTRATTERWQRHERLSFRSDYSAQRQIFYLLEQLGIRCPAPRFDPEGIVWEIEAPAELLARFRERAGRLLSR
jgi:putative IMPACT (imprinted ancient) family translation regulator